MGRMPRPLFSDVVVKNPLTVQLMDEIDSKHAKLPPDQRKKYLEENLKEMWASMEILAVGADCRVLQVGDLAMGSGAVMQGAQVTPCEEFLIVPERAFRAVW